MNFFIRCDSSYNIGSGHMMRCLNLAKLLIKKKNKVFLISNNIERSLFKFIRKKKINIIFIKKKTNQIEDAKETIKGIKKFYQINDWIIVDSYKLKKDWENKIKNYFCKLLVINDLKNIKHNCDIYLNQSILSNKIVLKKFFGKNTKILIGPKYSLLDQNFQKLRNKSIIRSEVKNILIFFGASDKNNLTKIYTDILLKKINQNIKLNIVIGTLNKNKKNLYKYYNNEDRIRFFYNLKNLAKIMTKSDLYVGSGGTTTWERCCLKLPSIVISTANNQETHSKYLSRINAIKYLGKHSKLSKNKFKKEFERIQKKKNLSKFSINSGKINDGLGCYRVYNQILSYDKNIKLA